MGKMRESYRVGIAVAGTDERCRQPKNGPSVDVTLRFVPWLTNNDSKNAVGYLVAFPVDVSGEILDPGQSHAPSL